MSGPWPENFSRRLKKLGGVNFYYRAYPLLMRAMFTMNALSEKLTKRDYS